MSYFSERKAVLYARVSTSQQNVENQLAELRQTAHISKWKVIRELVDHGISGSKGRTARPAFDELFRMIQRREVDVVMAWSIDRLGRSIQDLVGFMKNVQAADVDLFIAQQAVNTATPAGRMVFSIFSALGEYERELIRERINAGLARARAEGKRLGRPSVATLPSVITSVKLLREKGHSIHNIAKQLRIGVGTTQKILNAA
jgi:DNA invertase Pin-like site-specific DNA recombinase